MRLKSIVTFSIFALVFLSHGSVQAEPAPQAKESYEKTVKPFLTKHCYSCHDARQARAGFRIDELGIDFLEANAADSWLEVMDNINLGSMPPKGKPRPDAKESFAVVKWIGKQLQHAEKAAKLAGGRIPMRRLNRDEYANTIRDLFQMDHKLLEPIVEELPGDGKAEGFDRLGVALFFDQTQLKRSLQAAEKISELAIVNAAPPPRKSLVWQPEERMARPELKWEYEPYSGVRGHLVNTGAVPTSFGKTGVTWIHGLDVRDESAADDPWMLMSWIPPDLSETVQKNGWYRVRIRAGAKPRNPRDPVKIRLDYAEGTPIHDKVDFEITAPIDKPEVFEATVFLRHGSDGVQKKLVPWWNPDKSLIQDTKTHHSHVVATIGHEERIVEAMTNKKPRKEIDKLRAELAEFRKAAAKFKGPVREFRGNPKNAPQVFVDWIRVDGPYYSKDAIYEPKVHLTRFEAEKDRQGGMGIRTLKPTEGNRFVVDKKVEVEAGIPRYTIGKEGVTFIQGNDTYQKGNPWGRMASVTVDELVPEDGYYRIRVRAGVDKGTRDEPIRMAVSYNFKTPQELTTDVPITASISDPGVFELQMFLRRGADDQRRKITLMFNDLRKYIVSTPTFNQLFQDTIGTVGKIQKARMAGDKAEVERLTKFLVDARKRAKAWKGPVRHINPKYADDAPPKFYLDWMEFEGPLQTEWPPKSHKLVMFDGDERHDVAYAREVFNRFLPRAYRRPVTETEVERVVSLVAAELKAGKGFHAAIRIGIQRVLTSPGFLFIQEPTRTASKPRSLNTHELASRLSYFLWSTMPDDELFRLAKAGTLNDPKTLRAQVTRMLADPKAREFVENFGGQWLNVREFGSVMPAAEYKEYDSELEEASKLEAYAFVEEIVSKNLPITTFLDSDFVMVNERLARHYGIEGVQGDHFRRVALTPEHHRGGIFGMAGLMTLLADGTRTLPVRRAAWVVTNLFNDPPPPPPPNAGEVQPNTAGEKLTVRERLERHRNEPTCASCHATLDPYGLALENYDAIGKWRTQQNGEGFRGRNTPPLDVSGVLPTGKKFASLEEFKASLMTEKDRFAHAFSERMLTYALCRPVGYTDRKTVDQLMSDLKQNDYQIQSLIQAIVTSEPFLTK